MATGNSATTSYRYVAKSCNAAGCSPATSIAVVPFKPSALKATATTSRVDLVWRDNSGDEIGFLILRKGGLCGSAQSWTNLETTVPNMTAFRDTTAAAGTIYSYRVRATAQTVAMPEAAGNSQFTQCVSVTPP